MCLSNSLYLYLTVSFIEMLRAMLPLFIMIALYVTGLEKPTWTLVKAVSLTGLGCLISAYGEVIKTINRSVRSHG
jgi:drug/metabolite transporter (DMT)-like permease